MVTLDEVIYDMSVRELAYRTDLYGETGTFGDPQVIAPTDREALILWKAGRLRWNPHYKPWFYRDVWPILFRPDEFSYTNNVLGLSNFPHNQSKRGNFDPYKLGAPPVLDKEALEICLEKCLERHHSGDLSVDKLGPVVMLLEKQSPEAELRVAAVAEAAPEAGGFKGFLEAVRKALRDFALAILGPDPGKDFQAYLAKWRAAPQTVPDYAKARETLEKRVGEALERLRRQIDEELWEQVPASTRDHLRRYLDGRLLEECYRECAESSIRDPFRPYRQYVFDLLRQQGEENTFRIGTKPTSRVHGLPLMPLLAGDNPLTNTLPSKFLRLTDYQYYLLRQWALGFFFNEKLEGWGDPDPWHPYAGWVNRTGRDLDRGVLSNLLGGAFCPGGEAGWILRNPSIYLEPYRIKADPQFSSFRQTAAQANNNRGRVPEADYSAYVDAELSQDDDFRRGMQPGDLTKQMALPWQADFNECTTQTLDVTYAEWNKIYPGSEDDRLMKREQKLWETLWWPAHRPLQIFEAAAYSGGLPTSWIWVDWSRGVPATHAGDLKMVTEWWRLSFVRRFPKASLEPTEVPPPNPPPYIGVERTPENEEDE
jgi:hypothetical protein